MTFYRFPIMSTLTRCQMKPVQRVTDENAKY